MATFMRLASLNRSGLRDMVRFEQLARRASREDTHERLDVCIPVAADHSVAARANPGLAWSAPHAPSACSSGHDTPHHAARVEAVDANVSAATDAARVRPGRRPLNDGEPRRVSAAESTGPAAQGRRDDAVTLSLRDIVCSACGMRRRLPVNNRS